MLLTKGSPPPIHAATEPCHQIEHELKRPLLRSCAQSVSLQYMVALRFLTKGSIKTVLYLIEFIPSIDSINHMYAYLVQ